MRNAIFDFIGSHSTGKTTAQREALSFLDGRGFDVKLVESVSRTRLEEQRLWLYDKTDNFAQAWMSLANWSEILWSAMRRYITLCTDLGIRSAAYAFASDKVDAETCEYHMKMIEFFDSEQFLEKFQVIRIYTPIEFPLAPDGVRKEDEDYRTSVDSHIVRLMHKTEAPCYVLKGDPETRKAFLLKIIEEYILRKL
jgi:hypothetical protein